MATRKDSKGRVLRPGESERKKENRYVYKYTDSLKRRKAIYAKDLLELREKEKKLQKDQLDGLDTYVAGKASLNFVFDRYMTLKTELKQSTYSGYLYMYNRFVRDTFGKRKIADIKYSDVVFFYEQYLLKECELQVSTVENIHTILHPTFNLAVRDEIIRTNPCSGAMTQIKRHNKSMNGIRHALTIDQQKAFMDYTRESPVFGRWAPLFTVLFGTGGRIGEIIGLRWDDLDFDKREISINHSVSYIAKASDDYRSSFTVSLPKTEAGIRTIPMMDSVYEAFQEEYEMQEEEGFSQIEIDGMSGFIFTNKNGNLHNPSCVNRAIKRVYEAYNDEEVMVAEKEKREPNLIPHFSCHHMRHTFCTRMCEQEANVKVIQSIMGHKNIQTTLDIYADVTEVSKQNAIRNLANSIDVF